MKPIEQKSYKETTVTFVGDCTMLQTNNDVEFTDDIRQALSLAAYLEYQHNVDELVNKFI